MTSATAAAEVDPRRGNSGAASVFYPRQQSYATDNFLLYAAPGRRPIPVDLRATDHDFLATDHLVDRWGSGDTPEEALEELFVALVDYLQDLEEHAGRLSTRLQHHMRILKDVLGG